MSIIKYTYKDINYVMCTGALNEDAVMTKITYKKVKTGVMTKFHVVFHYARDEYFDIMQGDQIHCVCFGKIALHASKLKRGNVVMVVGREVKRTFFNRKVNKECTYTYLECDAVFEQSFQPIDTEKLIVRKNDIEKTKGQMCIDRLKF